LAGCQVPGGDMRSTRASVVTISDRLDTTKSRYGNILQQVFWAFVLASWVPVFYALALFPSTDPAVSTQGLLPIVVPTLRAYGHWAVNFANLGVVASLIIALVLGKPQYLLCLLFPLVCNFIPEFSDRVALNWEQALIYGAFILSFALAVGAFIRFGHLMAPSFGIFASVLLLDALVVTGFNWLPGEGSIASIFTLAYANVAPNPLAALLFLISALLLRIVFLAIDHNREFFVTLRKSGDLWPAARETLVLWLPMPVVFLLASGLYAVIFHYTGEAYVQNIVAHVQSPENGLVDPSSLDPAANAADYRALPTTREDATVYLERAHLLTIRAQIDARAHGLQGMAIENIDQAADEAASGIRSRMPERAPGTETSGCGWLDFGCHFMNLVKSITNSIYQSVRKDLLDEMDRRLDAAAARAGGDIEKFRVEATQEADNLARLFSQRVEVGLKSGFEAYRIVSQIALIYSIIILIKTYLIVFARVIFNAKHPHFAAFEPGKIPDSHGQITVRTTPASNEFRIPAADTKTYFVGRRLGLANHPQSKRHPRPLAAIFTRIANCAWVLNKVDMSKRDSYVGLTVSPPNSLVEWQLKKGERVIFWFSNFGAMSGDLQIDRIVTLSVAGLAFGRMIYYCAEGPGTLVLRTNNPAIVSGPKASRSYSTPCFIAWDTRCQFKIDANLTVNDTFRSGINVKKSAGDSVVVDTAPDGRQHMTTGILTYIKNFLLPI
jgi:hypothetical protein